MSDAATEWRWVQRYAEQFRACDLRVGEVAVLLSEAASSPLITETARMALESLGASVADVRMPTPANPGPVPIRSTGASVALAGPPCGHRRPGGRRLRRGLHRGGSAARPRTGRDPRRRQPRADDLRRASRERRALAPRPDAGAAGGARRVAVTGRRSDARHQRRRHRPAGTAGGRRQGRLPRVVHRAGHHRPLAGWPGAGLPRRAHRQRHAGAGAGRHQPHVQGVHPRAPSACGSSTTTWSP